MSKRTNAEKLAILEESLNEARLALAVYLDQPEEIEKALNAEKVKDINHLPNPLKVAISHGNTKTGNVWSVSLLPWITCPCRCEYCYALKIALFRKVVREAYARNTALLELAPAVYWDQVEKAYKRRKAWRWHVSGDIMNEEYLEHMVDLARRYPYVSTVAYTENHALVNAWIASNGDLPGNFHLHLSGGFAPVRNNPHGLSTTRIYNDRKPADPAWHKCLNQTAGGRCVDCAKLGIGCFASVRGAVIGFREH